MMPEILSDHLGDELEKTFKQLYTGGGVDFSSCMSKMLLILKRLADAGMITLQTKKKVEAFFSDYNDLSQLKVISGNSENIVMIHNVTHEQDIFHIGEFITWVISTLCNDPILKKNLCGRENYEGVKNAMNGYQKHKPLPSRNWEDFHIQDSTVFYTCTGRYGLHLFVSDIDSPGLLNDDINSIGILLKEELLDGKIYAIDNGMLYVEDGEKIAEIRYEGWGSCRESWFAGKIIDQLNDGSILYISEGKIFRIYGDGKREALIDKSCSVVFDFEGKEFCWKSQLREKDISKEEAEVLRIRKKHCLKPERASRGMLWKGLLFTLYDFDSLEFREKIGNRLKFAGIFDMVPMPFTIKEIAKRLSEIEGLCYEGNIAKAKGYVEAMSYIMQIENDNLDEQETINALTDLMDNVASNPYRKIANIIGMVMSSTEYIFTRCFKSMKDSYPFDTFESIEELSESGREELLSLIDEEIARLEKEIEKRERRKKSETDGTAKRIQNPSIVKNAEKNCAIDDSIYPNQINSYAYYAENSGEVKITILNMRSNMAVKLQVFDVQGNIVVKDAHCTDGKSITISNDSPGQHYLINIGQESGEGTYSLLIE